MLSAGMSEPGTNVHHDWEQQRNLQVESSVMEEDEVGTRRAKLLKRMCIVSLVTLFVSVLSVVVGIMAWMTSDSKFPYVMCGAAISGGGAILLTICPFWMYCEGKKTKTGNEMTSTFTCCLITMLAWFSFSLCGLAAALGLSGIWGVIDCDKAVRKSGYLDINPCTEHTNEKLILSILTMILTAVLICLSILIVSIYCCNSRTFGFKTSDQRRADFYQDIRREAREEALREFRSEQNAQRHIPARDMGRSPQSTAPPLEGMDRRTDQRSNYGRGRKSGPRDNSGQEHRAGPRSNEQDYTRHPRRPSPRSRPERGQRDTSNDNEEPPPRYDDVMKTYLKADDV